MCLFSEYYNRIKFTLIETFNSLYSEYENVFADFKALPEIPIIKLRKRDNIF
jgi:hypothetical protein